MEIDNTKRRSYALCPRKYYWEHVRSIRPRNSSTALRYGIVWHEIMDKYYSTIRDIGWEGKTEAITAGILAGKVAWEKETNSRSFYDDYRTLENCLTAFIGYIDNYRDDEGFIKILEVEKRFSIDLGYDTTFVGKVDAKVELNDAIWLMEHKTTGMPIDKQLKTLQRYPQIIGYYYAGTALSNEHIEGVLIPMLHTSATKSKVTGLYGKPRIEYRRSPQIFTDGDVQSWKDSFIWTANQIEDSHDKAYWPMQLDSCYHFGSCTYTNLCEQNEHVNDTNTQNYIEVEHWNVLTEGKEKKEK